MKRRICFYVGDVCVEADVQHVTTPDESVIIGAPDEWFKIEYQCGEEAVEDWRDVAILAFPVEFRRYEDSLP